MDRVKELYEYLINCHKADTLKSQIKDIEDQLDLIYSASTTNLVKDENALNDLAIKSHDRRLTKLRLQLELNQVEKQILQSELVEELRDWYIY